jgi:hypothetical protein
MPSASVQRRCFLPTKDRASSNSRLLDLEAVDSAVIELDCAEADTGREA